MPHLRDVVRKVCGKSISPSIGIRFQKHMNLSSYRCNEYGIDGDKRVKGRKEHLIMDTLGGPMAVKVHAANIHESIGAVYRTASVSFPRLKKIIAWGMQR